jgi:two-component system chemotaxis sensor kinase CheA
LDPLEAIKATFFQECDELLADLESGLLELEGGGGDMETVNAVFRAVHSVKGGAGAFGLEPLVRFAHVFETTLDEMRSGRLATEPAAVKVMLRAADVLADHVSAARGQGVVDEAGSVRLVGELKALCGGGAAEIGGDEVVMVDTEVEDDGFGDFDFTPVIVEIGGSAEAAPLDPSALPTWRIGFKPSRAMYAKANETALLLRELDRIGACQVTLNADNLPDFDALDPEESYFSWVIDIETDQGEGAIREVFEFVEDDCEIAVEATGAGVGAAAPLDVPFSFDAPSEPLDTPALVAAPEAEAAPAAPDSDVMALLERAKLAAAEIQATAPVSAPAPAAPRAATPPPPPPAAATHPADGGDAKASAGTTIRVDLERVDRLIDLVGELVINQAMLTQRVGESGLARSSTVSVGLEDLEHLTREIQDSVMAIRAQPVKSVFQRMPRLVREVAAMTGKQVRLTTEGENTEVDKTVIERLSDPLIHMIRNAIDHGLEKPEIRVAAGKPAEGVVKLCALHRSGRIVIEVSDDGAGINRERVKQIALDKGLIAPDATLTDEETDNLIFLPGFSTAATVSDISGRGVGMDVVRRQVQALGGRISITSNPGKGSTFSLSLPLTLAVLDGMVVGVSGHTLVTPLTAIIETLQPKTNDVRLLGPNGAVLAVRDAYVPLVDVGAVLGYRKGETDWTTGVVLLVESEVGGRAALLVDAIQGQRQVVIKSLEANYQRVEGIAAATILGDGRVALILDVDALIDVRRKDARRSAAPPAARLPLAS